MHFYIEPLSLNIFHLIGGGLTFPAMNVLIAEWAPKQERSTMSSLIYGGEIKNFEIFWTKRLSKFNLVNK